MVASQGILCVRRSTCLCSVAAAGLQADAKLVIPLGLDASPSFFEESRGLYISTDSSWGTRAKPQGGHVVMRMNGAILVGG